MIDAIQLLCNEPRQTFEEFSPRLPRSDKTSAWIIHYDDSVIYETRDEVIAIYALAKGYIVETLEQYLAEGE